MTELLPSTSALAAGSPSKTASFLLLGAWFVVQGTLFLLGLVAVSAQLGKLRASPAVHRRLYRRLYRRLQRGLRRGLQAVAGLLFIALALRIVRNALALQKGWVTA